MSDSNLKMEIKNSESKQQTKKITFKDSFIKRYNALLGKRYDEFIDISLTYLRKSIRINTIKCNSSVISERIGKRWEMTKIPWCDVGYWVKSERRDVGNMPEHFLGYIYVQEAASMIPPIVLDPKPGEVVLDMCASPGSKTTQIAQLMNNEGILVANDLTADRLKALGMNLQRCGVHCSIISMNHGRRFNKPIFDRVLVDAPCSGTGTIRKSFKTISMWNPNMVRRIAATQRQLVSSGFESLKPGGTMVFSTCTLEPEENEGTLSFLLDKYPEAEIQDIELEINRSEPVQSFEGTTYNKQVKKALRIWPMDNDTEGFFVSKIKKKE